MGSYHVLQGPVVRDGRKARAQWIEDRQAELLDCEYFHVVFTLPEELAPIAYQNKSVVYGILFRAAAETLRTIAADPRHLGSTTATVSIHAALGRGQAPER